MIALKIAIVYVRILRLASHEIKSPTPDLPKDRRNMDHNLITAHVLCDLVRPPEDRNLITAHAPSDWVRPPELEVEQTGRDSEENQNS